MHNQEVVLAFVRENPGCSQRQLERAPLKVSRNARREALRSLADDGVIENRGYVNAAKWWVKNTDFTVEEPVGEIDVEELRERRKQQFKRKRQAESESALIPVKVHMDGPVGVCLFGDPHVDDDGTDLAALERHVEVCNKTPGLFAGNLGDSSNNWVGRLARLYGEQSTSAAEAWALTFWLIDACTWLFLVAGNHDMWSGAGDPIKWIARQNGALYRETAVRLALKFPNKREVRINIRHDFEGTSQWNPAHGPMKAAQWGVRDHVLACGHKHKSGYGVIKDPSTGLICHCVQVASFKLYDRFAREKGFRDQNISPSATVVIDPEATDENALVQLFWNVEVAAEYLTWLRKKRKAR